MFSYLFCDAHFHLIPSVKENKNIWPENASFTGVSCAHSKEEFFYQEEYIKKIESDSVKIYNAFGLHPQNPDDSNIDFLEKLAKEKRIIASGECGFDFYTEDLKKTEEMQKYCFNAALDICLKYCLPIIIHNRKALEKIFLYKQKLKKLPSCIFHGFAFGINEALSLVNNGINAYFSFGKNLLRGSKKNAQALFLLDKKRILLETDAPFMTLKNQSYTSLSDIKEVYKKASSILFIKEEELMDIVSKNFFDAYFLRTSTI